MIWNMSLNQSSLVIVLAACIFLGFSLFGKRMPKAMRLALGLEAGVVAILIVMVQIWSRMP